MGPAPEETRPQRASGGSRAVVGESLPVGALGTAIAKAWPGRETLRVSGINILTSFYTHVPLSYVGFPLDKSNRKPEDKEMQMM